MKIEACRAFSWKAAHYLDLHDSEGHAVGAMAKVFCGEVLFGAVFKAMQVMGVNSLDRKHPVERFLREALVFPLHDAGNIGMQMRKIWGVMADPEYHPRAIADSKPIEFKKSMEGLDRRRSVLTPTRGERHESAIIVASSRKLCLSRQN
jgi:nitroalkane oxidase